ncbi:hypothetical protein LJC34_07900 [Oscillospiraceae bacterium OttesenSCG-928-G22]|nr:hypothetical protein [Oscillospiraceae bacterium OttesenSCG-928-G22]
MNIRKGKELLQAVDTRERISDEWDRVLETDMSDENEVEFDLAYKAYWAAVNDLTAFLVESVPGLNEITAKKMALHKRADIVALFEMSL